MKASKKQMIALEELLKGLYPDDRIYSRLERDATGNAYVRHDGEWFCFKSNTEAYEFVLELF